MVINTIYKKLKKIKLSTTAIPVVLVVIGSLVNLGLVSRHFPVMESFGGPTEANSFSNQALAFSLLAVNGAESDFDVASSDDDFGGFVIVDRSALVNTANPLSNALPTRDGLMVYKVQEGDTLSQIAANFGISLNTILWANPKLRANLKRPGHLYCLFLLDMRRD